MNQKEGKQTLLTYINRSADANDVSRLSQRILPFVAGIKHEGGVHGRRGCDPRLDKSAGGG